MLRHWNEYLQPLPAVRFQMKARKTVTVMKNSYVMLNKHHYSVPREYYSNLSGNEKEDDNGDNKQ